MPYALHKSESGYKVANKETGETYSKRPQTRAMATRQMRAIYASEGANDGRKS